MPPASPDAVAIGVDFGTSNTVVALAHPDGRVEALRFARDGGSLSVYASALCFWPERVGTGRRTLVEGGPWAVDRFLEGVEIAATITRRDFEDWIAEDVRRIAGTVDEVLDRAGTPAEAIDRVFLTGGTSFVPAIRRLFAERFGEARLTSADQFESIAYGLALIGQSENPAQWRVAA